MTVNKEEIILLPGEAKAIYNLETKTVKFEVYGKIRHNIVNIKLIEDIYDKKYSLHPVKVNYERVTIYYIGDSWLDNWSYTEN